MTVPNAPCQGCTNRTPECHAECDYYKGYKMALEMQHEAYNNSKEVIGHLADVESYRQMEKYKRKGKYWK